MNKHKFGQGKKQNIVRQQEQQPTSSSQRIQHLDGHRGLAILLVILYHAYTRWPELVPYGDQYASFPAFKFGWLGVELFFMISGFVIVMSLERYLGIREFLYRRWLRLFPAMLICSIFIFATAGYFFERPAGSPHLTSLIPGLTFIDISWWEAAIGQPIQPLEGAFWSLYVEFKFYIFSAIAYYWKGRNFLIGALVTAFGLSVVSQLGFEYIGDMPFSMLETITSGFSFHEFGWFATGAGFYLFTQSQSWRWFIFALSLSLFNSAFFGFLELDGALFLTASLVSLFFAASMINKPIQHFLSNRFLLFFGFISYPLYLIHENMMISMIIKMGDRIDKLPAGLLPIIAVALLSGIAIVVAKYAEPFTNKLLKRVLS